MALIPFLSRPLTLRHLLSFHSFSPPCCFQGALEFAKKLVAGEPGAPQLIDANTVLDIFLSVNLLREATAFLLEALKGNRKEEVSNCRKEGERE